jgi:predicted metalloprotease
MRLDNERPSRNIEDRRGQGGFGRGFGFPRGSNGRGFNIPIGRGRGGFSFSTLLTLIVVYFAIKLIFGVDLLDAINGGTTQIPRTENNPPVTVPNVPIGNNGN